MGLEVTVLVVFVVTVQLHDGARGEREGTTNGGKKGEDGMEVTGGWRQSKQGVKLKRFKEKEEEVDQAGRRGLEQLQGL